jgi:heme oxygenase
MTTTSDATTEPTFSASLRAGSRADHEHAEHAGFVVDLFHGRLPIDAYAAMLGQLWHVYDALEGAGATLAGDPVVAPFLDDRLLRLERLDADIRSLTGSGPAAVVASPSTIAYADRIRTVAAEWPAGYVAHHYTRYLGDLSGGQAIRSVVQRTYGLADGAGTSFYDFPEITDRRAWKDGYRAALDAAPWDADERAAVADEVASAYAHNTAIFVVLGEQFPG